MTDEELIEQIARTVGQKIEGAAEDMDSVWYGIPLWMSYIEEARAILPFIQADREQARMEERAAIVAWLRKLSGYDSTTPTFQDRRLAHQLAALDFSNAIEAGEHLK